MEEKTKVNLDDLDLISDQEINAFMKKIKKQEEESTKNILKYFDRIHNKLFTFNNILIAGFYALSKMEEDIPVKTIIIPILNFVILIYVEYRLMESYRKQSNISQKTLEEVEKINKEASNITLISLFTIFTTSVVLIIFLYYLLTS